MKYVNAPVMKKDAMALVTGKPVYMDDVAPKDCLIVKVLRSPHAHALIEEINITNALKQKGIECTNRTECLPVLLRMDKNRVIFRCMIVKHRF